MTAPEQPPANLHARIYRAVYSSPGGAAVEAVLAEVEPELNALRAELETAQRQLARARERVAWAQADREQLREQLATLSAIFEGFQRLLATSSRDWAEYRVDAWLWAVICGWDCEQTRHTASCVHGAMEETAQAHGWAANTIAKARRYRAAVRDLPAAGTAPIA